MLSLGQSVLVSCALDIRVALLVAYALCYHLHVIGVSCRREKMLLQAGQQCARCIPRVAASDSSAASRAESVRDGTVALSVPRG